MQVPSTPTNIKFGTPKGKEPSTSQNHSAGKMLQYLNWQFHLKVTTVSNAKLLAAAIPDEAGYVQRIIRSTVSAEGFRSTSKLIAGDATDANGGSHVSDKSEGLKEPATGNGEHGERGNPKPISKPIAAIVVKAKCAGEESAKAVERPPREDEELGRRGPAGPRPKPGTATVNSPEPLQPPAKTHAAHKRIYKILKKSIMSDEKRCGTSKETSLARVQPAWESMSRYMMEDGQWQDGYCDNEVSMYCG